MAGARCIAVRFVVGGGLQRAEVRRSSRLRRTALANHRFDALRHASSTRSPAAIAKSGRWTTERSSAANVPCGLSSITWPFKIRGEPMMLQSAGSSWAGGAFFVLSSATCAPGRKRALLGQCKFWTRKTVMMQHALGVGRVYTSRAREGHLRACPWPCTDGKYAEGRDEVHLTLAVEEEKNRRNCLIMYRLLSE